MPKAIVNGTVIAESDQCERVEGNYYFPPDAVKPEYLHETDTHTVCPWKGTAHYYTVTVNGQEIKDAAWSYPQAKEKAKAIEGYFAFYTNKGIKIES